GVFAVLMVQMSTFLKIFKNQATYLLGFFGFLRSLSGDAQKFLPPPLPASPGPLLAKVGHV
ncbi:MAG: hypothetical protein FWD36_02960, partial [Treponema sp.]|nr:hypothetical protein [Treponema sp.]